MGGRPCLRLQQQHAESISAYFDFTVEHPSRHHDLGLAAAATRWIFPGGLTPAIINLAPGTFSSANGDTNNIGIAYDTVIETAIGGGGDDTIHGNAYDNILVGGAGNDALYGGFGNDTLTGGPGNDTVTGGPGADRFALRAPSDGVDTFLDFSRYERDLITLDHVGFGLQGTGSLAAAGVSFVYGFPQQGLGYDGSSLTGPAIIDDRGHLYWDPDGIGASPATLLAYVLGGRPAPVIVERPPIAPIGWPGELCRKCHQRRGHRRGVGQSSSAAPATDPPPRLPSARLWCRSAGPETSTAPPPPTWCGPTPAPARRSST